MSRFYFRKACLSYELHLKYLRAAAKTKSKPRRRKLLSRAAKYLEKNKHQLEHPIGGWYYNDAVRKLMISTLEHSIFHGKQNTN